MSIFKRISDILSESTDQFFNGTANVGKPDQNSVLNPPAPPIPVSNKSMSVNIAVNGKSYGPYERATLLNMIANGSVTPQTLVFMKGMSGWKPAGEVAGVKELFSDSISVPDVPPVPWAEATESTSAQPSTSSNVEEENILSPRLNRLITAAVADGEISDMERQVLVRNAQEEGVAMDEFVMILEARLFEQRQVLMARQKELEHKHQMEKVSVQAAAAKVAAAPLTPRENKTNDIKCPHCGAPRKALATTCPECGYEYKATSSEKLTAWERLSRQIAEVQNKPKGIGSTIMDIYLFTEDKQIAQLIKGCSIPTTKDELFEFFSSCAPLAKKGLFAGNTEGNPRTCKAYYSKAQQILIKARIVMKDDPDLLSQMEDIAKQYKIKA